MLQCLSVKAASCPASPGAINSDPLPQASQANPADGATPASSTAAQSSPTVNLSREFSHALQTRSYNEIWSRIHVFDPSQDQLQTQENNGDRTDFLLSQVLRPTRECVEEALSRAKQTTLTSLISAYFQHSENATSVCLALYQRLHRARELYRPFCDLLEVLPGDLRTIDQSQCNLAFDIFIQFDSFDNPFPCPDSHNFQETQHCFAQLRQQLDHRLRKSRSRVRLLRRATAGSALCLVGVVVGVAASAAVIASHALPTLVVVVAGPLCSAYLPRSFKKKELAHISQLDTAARGTFVLNNYLDTIDRLVSRLHMAIESDKLLIRVGLERGRDVYPVQEVVKQLRKNHVSFAHLLNDLERHICDWCTNVNEARSLLLQEIHLHRTYSS